MKNLSTTLILIAYFLCACSDDSIDYDAQLDNELQSLMAASAPNGHFNYYILPHGNDLTQIPQDPSNTLNYGKVELGKLLFFETAFSTAAHHSNGIQTYSCATCHIPEAGFRPNGVQGIADGGLAYGLNGEKRLIDDNYEESELDVQAARPLSLVNVAFVKNTFWSGQFGSEGANVGTEELWDQREETEGNHNGLKAIETQNIEGLHVHRMHYDLTSIESYGYKAMFDACFDDIPEEERYSNTTASLAISAYIRCLIADKAPFQEYLNGDPAALSRDAKEGAILFFGKANCSHCHYEKNLGSNEFHALGVKDMDQNPLSVHPNPNDIRNLGRGGFTQKAEDMFKFKVPGLYNVSDASFYFHGSSMTDLQDVIRYKSNALRENIRVSQLQMSEKLKKIELSDKEVSQIALFLSESLSDPHLTRYKPNALPSGLCFPNNDALSRQDLGCD